MLNSTILELGGAIFHCIIRLTVATAVAVCSNACARDDSYNLVKSDKMVEREEKYVCLCLHNMVKHAYTQVHKSSRACNYLL